MPSLKKGWDKDPIEEARKRGEQSIVFLDRELRYAEVDKHRREDCPFYDACLKVAMNLDKKGFSCLLCRKIFNHCFNCTRGSTRCHSCSCGKAIFAWRTRSSRAYSSGNNAKRKETFD